jgi:hypothetical protein
MSMSSRCSPLGKWRASFRRWRARAYGRCEWSGRDADMSLARAPSLLGRSVPLPRLFFPSAAAWAGAFRRCRWGERSSGLWGVVVNVVSPLAAFSRVRPPFFPSAAAWVGRRSSKRSAGRPPISCFSSSQVRMVASGAHSSSGSGWMAAALLLTRRESLSLSSRDCAAAAHRRAWAKALSFPSLIPFLFFVWGCHARAPSFSLFPSLLPPPTPLSSSPYIYSSYLLLQVQNQYNSPISAHPGYAPSPASAHGQQQQENGEPASPHTPSVSYKLQTA